MDKEERSVSHKDLSRRDFLKTGGIGAAALVSIAGLNKLGQPTTTNAAPLNQNTTKSEPNHAMRVLWDRLITLPMASPPSNSFMILYGAFIVEPDPEKYSGDEKEIAKTRNHQYPENENVNAAFLNFPLPILNQGVTCSTLTKASLLN